MLGGSIRGGKGVAVATAVSGNSELSPPYSGGGSSGISFSASEEYVWLDREGRPTSPPPPSSVMLLQRRDSKNRMLQQQQQQQESPVRTVTLELCKNDNLGLMIRGGIEYGLGIYVTGVDEGSVASRHRIRAGDEILEANGRPFSALTHDEAVHVLKYSQRLSLRLRDVGKVPHSSAPPPIILQQQQQQQAVSSSSSKASVSSASTVASLWSPKEQQQQQKADEQSPSGRRQHFMLRHSRQQQQQSDQVAFMNNNARGMEETISTKLGGQMSSSSSPSPSSSGLIVHRHGGAAADVDDQDMDSPELSMVLEKALVLFSADEFSALGLLLDEYRSRTISVDDFAEELARMISNDDEKSSFFTEIREIVRPEDLFRFDQLVYDNDSKRRFSAQFILDELQSWHDDNRSEASYEEDCLLDRQPGDILTEDIFHTAFRDDLMGRLAFDDPRCSRKGGKVFDDNDGGGVFYEEDEDANQQQSHFEDKSRSTFQMVCNKLQATRAENLKAFNGAAAAFYSEAPYPVRIRKSWPTLGIAIEGGSNTQQSLPRVIAVQPEGAAAESGGLRVGQLIQEVDGIRLAGLPHAKVAKIIAECYAKKDRSELRLVVRDHRPTPAERRRSCMMPQS